MRTDTSDVYRTKYSNVANSENESLAKIKTNKKAQRQTFAPHGMIEHWVVKV